MQPQHRPLDGRGNGVAQNGVQGGGKEQGAQGKKTATVRSTDTQEARQTLADTIQQARGRLVTDDVALRGDTVVKKPGRADS